MVGRWHYLLALRGAKRWERSYLTDVRPCPVQGRIPTGGCCNYPAPPLLS